MPRAAANDIRSGDSRHSRGLFARHFQDHKGDGRIRSGTPNEIRYQTIGEAPVIHGLALPLGGRWGRGAQPTTINRPDGQRCRYARCKRQDDTVPHRNHIPGPRREISETTRIGKEITKTGRRTAVYRGIHATRHRVCGRKIGGRSSPTN